MEDYSLVPFFEFISIYLNVLFDEPIIENYYTEQQIPYIQQFKKYIFDSIYFHNNNTNNSNKKEIELYFS